MRFRRMSLRPRRVKTTLFRPDGLPIACPWFRQHPHGVAAGLETAKCPDQAHRRALRHASEQASVTRVPMLVIGDRVLTGLEDRETLAAVIDEQLGGGGRVTPRSCRGRPLPGRGPGRLLRHAQPDEPWTAMLALGVGDETRR